MENKHIQTFVVFTDGSHQKAGCGYGVYFPNGEIKNISKPFKKSPLTNQRAELYAIYKALKVICKKFTFDNIHLYTDSQYSINSLTIWIQKWKDNNWKGSNKKKVENTDIIIKIDNILQQYPGKIHFNHVRAHTGKTDYYSIGNQIADELANAGARTIIDNVSAM